MITDGNVESGSGTDDSTVTPFNLLEEFWRRCERSEEPANIHMEFCLAGHIEEDRFRTAIAAAFTKHPMMRARRVASSRLKVQSTWEVVNTKELPLYDVVRVVQWQNDAEVARLRAELFSSFLDIHEVPALKFLLIHCPDSDLLLFSINHTLCDGTGALRFLHSIARAYRGAADPLPSIDPIAARDLASGRFKPSEPGLRRPYRPKTIPASTIPANPASVDSPCYGFHHVTIPPAVVSTFDAKRLVPEATINDLLLTALLRTINAWNARRGTSQSHFLVHTPVNLRPQEWRNEIAASLAVSGNVGATAEQLATPESTMAAVVAQTRWLKAGGAMAFLDAPAWVHQAFVLAMPVIARWTRPTAVLTNLGRLDDPPDFGEAGRATSFWVSGGLGMPTGLLIGAATLDGALFLSFCYRHALFDDGTAREFADLFVEHLLVLGTDQTGPTSHGYAVG
jgi:NRPS condensation-like uncharacterized protein